MADDVLVLDVGGVRVIACAGDGADLGNDAAARKLIGDAIGADARWIVMPASRLADAFFDLRTRIAGEVLQKFVNYQIGVAIVGDLSTHLAASDALRDFVRESNRGRTVWFVEDIAAFERKLAAARGG